MNEDLDYLINETGSWIYACFLSIRVRGECFVNVDTVRAITIQRKRPAFTIAGEIRNEKVRNMAG